MRAFTFKWLIFGTLFLVIGCDSTDIWEPVPGQMGITRCDKCHTYPGSILCKTDTVQVHGIQATQCFKCHNDAVNVDSSWDDASNAFVYHDKMIDNNGSFIQSTGPQHANGMKSMNFAQCTQCHSFPPSSGKHAVHVIDNGKECLDCHFGTVKCDTIITDIESYLQQSTIRVPGGSSLPLLDTLHHINNKVDVVFAKNGFERQPEINGNDTIYPYPLLRFNPKDKSCSSIECHSGTEFGGAPIDRSLWEETVK